MKKSLLLASFLSLLFSCNISHPAVSLALLGDLMLGRGVEATPDSLAYLRPELQAADLALANLESPIAKYPLSTGSQTGYTMCASASAAGFLASWGLDLLSLANNHCLDCNPEGLHETVSILTNLGLTPIRPGPEPLYREINGLKLAFLAFDDISSPLDGPATMQAIRAARADGALVVISIHWGMEYQQGASSRQKALAQQFTDAGAALVVGTHPHVLQPARWVRSARGKALVIYSLGNALFDQGGLADTRQSALVVVTLDEEGVKSARATPFEIDVTHSRIFQPDAHTVQKIHNRINLP